MTPLKILLLGSTGQIGQALQLSLQTLGKVAAPTRQQCDLYDPGALHRLLHQTTPQVIVNAAAYTAVDDAQHHPALAMQLNADLPQRLAEHCRASDTVLVHFSSDYVYDGQQSRPYRESDEPNPLNVYGRSKLAGDQAAAQVTRHLIIRSGWIYHRRGQNFLRTILRRAQQQSRLQVVSDQIGAPNSAEFIAQAATWMTRALLHHEAPPGLYHVACSGQASWFDYARCLLTEAAEQGVSLRCPAEAVQPIASEVLSRLAPRPAYTVLDTAAVSRQFGLHMPPWQELLRYTIRDLVQTELSPRTANHP